MLSGLLWWKRANWPIESWLSEQRSESRADTCKNRLKVLRSESPRVEWPWVFTKEEARNMQRSQNLRWGHQGTGGPDRHPWGQLLGMVYLWCEAKWFPISGQGWGQGGEGKDWRDQWRPDSGDQASQLGKSPEAPTPGSQGGFFLSHKTLVALVYSSIMWTAGTWWQLKPFHLGGYTRFFSCIFFNSTVIERLSWSNQGSTI